MRVLLSAASLAVCGMAPAETEIPAEALRRTPPAYPTTCLMRPDASDAPQKVVVVYNVTRDGRVEEARARESTDPCFNETAIAAVRSWTFTPRRVDGEARQQDDLETTFTFLINESTQYTDFDARPSVRVPPQYPEECQVRASSEERVFVEFDVTPDGKTDNLRVAESSDRCFNKAALDSVKKWRYRPKIEAGNPVVRNGVQTTIVFQLFQGARYPRPVRTKVFSRLQSVRRMILHDKPLEGVFAELVAIEQEYGDEFSPAELALFHQFRGAARVDAGEYAGALDDLRVAQRLSWTTPEGAEAIARMIVQLEMRIAADAAARGDTGEDAQGDPAAAEDDRPKE